MAKRQIIAGKGVPSQPQPFPTAVKVGNVLFSSAVGGQDPATGEVPEDKAVQIARANMRTIVERGGGTVGDIGKVVAYLMDRADRDLVNAEWIRTFPDENDRPVRHTIASDIGRHWIRLEFIAVL